MIHRHLTKELLAVSLVETFPRAQLLGGAVSEIGFSYDVLLPQGMTLSSKDLEILEDKMRYVAHEKRPIRMLEMMRENAAELLRHHGQPHLAKAALASPENIVTLFKMGEFYDLCPPPLPENSDALPAFRLLEVSQKGEKTQILGTAFADKTELKNYLKRYQKAKKSDYRILGPKLGVYAYFSPGWVFLPKGMPLIQGLKEQWQQLHTERGFQFLEVYHPHDPLALHQEIFDYLKPSRPYRLAHFTAEGSDRCTIFSDSLSADLISSLQLIEKVIKIFGFEMKVYHQRGDKQNFSLLQEGLKETEIAFEEREGEENITFVLLDPYGQGWEASSVSVCRRQSRIHYSLLGSIETWVMLKVACEFQNK